jgi:thiamine pyrophosphate-dependent acetolactate synthase large subunit-like protein
MGDGGLCMFGLELLTAVRHGLDLTVVVLNDRRLSMIADHQARRFGHEFGVDVVPPVMGPFAEAVGATYIQLGDDWATQLDNAVRSPGVTLVEAVLELPAAVSRRSGVARLVQHTKGLRAGLSGRLNKK